MTHKLLQDITHDSRLISGTFKQINCNFNRTINNLTNISERVAKTALALKDIPEDELDKLSQEQQDNVDMILGIDTAYHTLKHNIEELITIINNYIKFDKT